MPALFTVFNETDGIYCHPEPRTYEQCQEFVREFPQRFARQGYYMTWEGHRIPVAEVCLKILPAEDDAPADKPKTTPLIQWGRIDPTEGE